MDGDTARKILRKLSEIDVGDIEFTGGAPELNPYLTLFLEEISGLGKQTIVRTNLTALDIPEYRHFIDMYRTHGVKIVGSLPSYFQDLTDQQRGRGVFAKSIHVLKKLNAAGYGNGTLSLDLVYNPQGDYLPPSEKDLEKDYKKLLKDSHGISFNRLITITNSPIGGFREFLLREGKLDGYMDLLMNNFNSETLQNIMCRRLLSIDYRGYIYDCDFNLALNTRIQGYEGTKFWEIDFESFSPAVTCGEHCYACTVNRGSSCHGVLLQDQDRFDVRDTVQHYYGSVLERSGDLKTGACCTPDSIPPHVRDVLPNIAEEIKSRYYGCGSPIPPVLEGLRALDIGCGTGRDTYILSKLVGPDGFVSGIDMTRGQIEIAKKYQSFQTNMFGYGKPNTHFIYDYIENLTNYFTDESLDLVVSNCVVNLIEFKERFMHQVFKILKYGGEFYFSDIYADRRLPHELKTDPVLYGECLGGALYWKDFERIARDTGFTDPRIVSKRAVDISNEEIRNLVGNTTFFSITYRLWKIEALEDSCEDYGLVAFYRGGVSVSPSRFVLDRSHIFEKDKPVLVCGNTALMLSKTRLSEYFEVSGDFKTHFGEFRNCSTSDTPKPKNDNNDSSLCC
jgi:radical SAM/Cys-rich protein